MKVLVVGGTGHAGKFLCDILKQRGHEVVIASRGKTEVQSGFRSIVCDSSNIDSMLSINEDFDSVAIFPGSAYTVYKALASRVNHIVACGSLWMFGYPTIVPTPEIYFEDCWFSGYARRFNELNIMINEHKCNVTAIMPPNFCGPGKIPLDGLGGRDVLVHKAHQRGELVYLPDGPECLISPCDAYDIAMLFALAIENPEKSKNQFFNVGAEGSITSTKFIENYSKIYGVNIPVEYVCWDKYVKEISPSQGHWWHFYAQMCPDISKAKNLLGFKA